MNLKSIIAAAALALTATTATAETQVHKLHSYKHWIVEFNQRNASAWCSASNGNFILNADNAGNYEIQIFVPGADFGDHRAPFSVAIDNLAMWTQKTAQYYKQSIFTGGIKTEILVEMARGQRIHTFNSKGQHVSTYSLAGSTAAIKALADCGSKLPKGAVY